MPLALVIATLLAADDVPLDTGEAEAALAIVDLTAAGRPTGDNRWTRTGTPATRGVSRNSNISCNFPASTGCPGSE